MSRINYIFVDFENVPVADLDRIANRPVKVMLILGERHKSLPLPMVKLIQKYSDQVALVETGLNGKNALDFVLACEVGRQSMEDPDGYFHVVSRDKGFDALIKHLKQKGLHAGRRQTLGEILVLMNLAERLTHVAAQFKVGTGSRPKTRKTLESHVHAAFGKVLSTEEVKETIQGLVAQKLIALTEKGAVTYKV